MSHTRVQVQFQRSESDPGLLFSVFSALKSEAGQDLSPCTKNNTNIFNMNKHDIVSC